MHKIGAALTLCCACFLSAQQPPDASAISSRGEEVVVDVTVRDKKGHAVNSLSQNDFTVLDNGNPRPINSFRLVQGTDAVTTQGTRTPLDPLRQVRLITLIFDRMDIDGRRLSRQAGLDLIKENLPQNVYVAVFALDHQLQALQAFTNDRELLRKAIEKVTNSASGEFASVSAQVESQVSQLAGPNTAGAQSLEQQVAQMSVPTDARGAPDAGAAFNQLVAEVMLQTLRFSQRAENAQTGRASIFGLLAAVREQYRLPGRKAILYFSNGFTIPQGSEEAFQSVISTANKVNLSFYPIDTHGLTLERQNASATSQLAAATSSSASAGSSQPVGDNHITIANAQSVDSALDAGKLNTQDILATLAAQTGGFLTANTNDFRGPVHRISEEIETYYELTFLPELEKYDGSFHKIGIQSHRGDLRMQSRSGYFALPPGMAKGGAPAGGFEAALLRVLSTPPLTQAFPFESAGLHYRSDGHNQTCEFVIDMPLSNVSVEENLKSGKYEGGLTYVALVKNDAGVVVKKLSGDVPVELTRDQILPFHQSRFTETEFFDLAPGHYTIETAVFDRHSGKTSARKSAVLVPAPSASLALSSVALIRKWKAKEAEATEDDPFVFGGKAMTPTLDTVVSKAASTSLPFYVTIYPDATNAEKPELFIEFNRDGRSKRFGTTPLGAPDAQGGIRHVATAPIEQLEPGNYEVRFVVKQGKEIAQEEYSLLLKP